MSAASPRMQPARSCSASPACCPTAKPSAAPSMPRRRDRRMFTQPETWVAIAFVILLVLFAYLGIHKTVLTALDHRAQRIRAELDDARRLKEEAAKLLGEYKTRRASAEREAEEIIANAKSDAERIATEAKAKMEDFVARRTKTAES